MSALFLPSFPSLQFLRLKLQKHLLSSRASASKKAQSRCTTWCLAPPLLCEEKSVYRVCLGTEEQASHMIRDDVTGGWMVKWVRCEDVLASEGGKKGVDVYNSDYVNQRKVNSRFCVSGRCFFWHLGKKKKIKKDQYSLGKCNLMYILILDNFYVVNPNFFYRVQSCLTDFNNGSQKKYKMSYTYDKIQLFFKQSCTFRKWSDALVFIGPPVGVVLLYPPLGAQGVFKRRVQNALPWCILNSS